MTQQLKALLLLAALFITSSLAGSCPSTTEIEDCTTHAFDPAEGNCWWGYDSGSCLNLFDATSPTECSEWCYSCLSCVYDFGCCEEGNPQNFQQCYDTCISNSGLN